MALKASFKCNTTGETYSLLSAVVLEMLQMYQ